MSNINVLGDKRPSRYKPGLAEQLNQEANQTLVKSTSPSIGRNFQSPQTQSSSSPSSIYLPMNSSPSDMQRKYNLENSDRPVGFVSNSDGISHQIRLDRFILLPGKEHCQKIKDDENYRYGYQDRIVNSERSKTSTSWEGAHKSLAKKGAQMMTLRQFVDFLQLLRSGVRGESVYDGAGKRISDIRVQEIYNNIVHGNMSHGSQWMDLSFENDPRAGGNTIGYGHKIKGVNIVSGDSAPANLLPFLNQEKSINLDDWLDRADIFGLPPPDIKDGNMLYSPPKFTQEMNWHFYFGTRHFHLPITKDQCGLVCVPPTMHSIRAVPTTKKYTVKEGIRESYPLQGVRPA